MTTVALSPQIASHLKTIEGHTNDDKLLRLLETYLASQIRACEQEISDYEVKYRSTFAEFAQDWERDEILNKHDHAVERDYMEWEGLVAEKHNWLEQLRSLPKRKVVGQACVMTATEWLSAIEAAYWLHFADNPFRSDVTRGTRLRRELRSTQTCSRDGWVK